MQADVLREIAADFTTLAAAHHLTLAVIMVIFWMRRRSMERAVAAYFVLAFGTTAGALFTRTESLAPAVVAAGLAALWAIEAVRPRNVLNFKRTPMLRLVVMSVLGFFGFVYPGYSGDLPSFIFSPLGVILPPALIIALAVMNSALKDSNRVLHWAHAVSGLAYGAIGIAAEGWVHLPLLAISAYAIPLLLGRGGERMPRDETSGKDVRQIRDRMYARKTLLPGPRPPRARRFKIRRHRR
jgi:hypothetical protein